MMSRLRRPIHAGLSAACLGPPLGLAVRRTLSRHPRLLDRLGWSEERVVLIEPQGLSFGFVLRCSACSASISVCAAGAAPDADARIRGPLPDLLDLVSGAADGDAQFFARTLFVDGDTALVVALRNALDDARIDPLADFLPLPKRLQAPARRLLPRLAGLARRASGDIAQIEAILSQLAGAAPEEPQ